MSAQFHFSELSQCFFIDKLVTCPEMDLITNNGCMSIISSFASICLFEAIPNVTAIPFKININLYFIEVLQRIFNIFLTCCVCLFTSSDYKSILLAIMQMLLFFVRCVAILSFFITNYVCKKRRFCIGITGNEKLNQTFHCS